VETGRRPQAEEVESGRYHLLQKLVKDHPDVPDYKRDLVVWYHNRASMLKAINRLLEAEKPYRDALVLEHELVAAHGDQPLFHEDLAGSYSNLGELLRLLRRYPEARKAHETAVKRIDLLAAQHRGEPVYRRKQAAYRYHLAQLLQTIGQLQEAEEVYRQILGPFEKKDPGLPFDDAHYRLTVAASYQNLATQWAKADRIQEAESTWGRALPIWEGLTKDAPKNASYQGGFGLTLSNLAQSLHLRGKLPEARKGYEQALSSLRQAVELEPRHPEYGFSLRNVYKGLRDTLVQLKEHGELARRAEELARHFPESAESLYDAATFLRDCESLAAKDVTLSSAKRNALAQTYGRRMGALIRAASQRKPDRVDVQNGIAWFLSVWEDREKGDASRALDLAKQAVNQEPGNGGYWGSLGAAHYRAGNWQAAVDALEKARQLPDGEMVDYDLFLAMARWQTGDKDQAGKNYDRAVNWVARNSSQVDDALRRLQAEAAAVLMIK
jgi:tetratricopeptide (TPR) repeat protein